MDIADQAQQDIEAQIELALATHQPLARSASNICSSCRRPVERARQNLRLERCLDCQIEFEKSQHRVGVGKPGRMVSIPAQGKKNPPYGGLKTPFSVGGASQTQCNDGLGFREKSANGDTFLKHTQSVCVEKGIGVWGVFLR